MILSVGSKVFLMGEYLALNGGPALLASLDPRFELHIEKGEGKLVNVPLLSPAGIFYANNKSFFSQYNIEFFDPYDGSGGWGASSAQFAMIAAFFYGQGAIQNNAQLNLDLQQVDKDYLKITSQNAVGIPPSGLDVLAQLRGGMVFIDRNKGRIENVVWPFNDISFLMFATGEKVATHTHLNTLAELFENELPLAELKESVEKFSDAFLKLDKQALIDSVKEFRNTLFENKLEIRSTTDWINKIINLNGVLAVKGCGALGADVIMLMIEKSEKKAIMDYLRALGVQKITSKDQLTGPIHIAFATKSEDIGLEVVK